MNNMNEFKGKKTDDLVKLLDEKREALRMFRFGLSGSKIKNVKEGSALKKDVARLMAELKGRTE